ncbi:MAG: DUF1080 domain-containing protein [Saprospiraceae bacterium]|nr:DUF1080 domain-containing protein [Saprospiraceae bacterium]
MKKNTFICQLILLVLALVPKTNAQQMTDWPLNDLSSFRVQAGNWKTASSVYSAFSRDHSHHKIEYVAGSGILVNDNDKDHNSPLLSVMEHQDIDPEFEFMVPAGSNSGLYLQGRYEVQIFDSWGKKAADFTDLGGIYRNWESDPKTAYAGKAPLMNAARPSGIWQKMFISFKGPRFDATGKKISNALFKKVMINGQLVHDNVEVPQPTGGPIVNNEVAKGPLMIQGDHGPVAFRNIRYRTFEDLAVSVENVTYKYWKGPYEYEDDFKMKKEDKAGNSPEGITWDVSPVKDFFGLQLSGDLNIPLDDTYYISTIYNGNLAIYIDGQVVKKISRAWDWDRPAKSVIDLKAGKHKIDIYFCRADAWLPPAIGIFFESNKIVNHGIHARSSLQPRESNFPILVKPTDKPKILRAFLDYNGKRNERMTHTVGVGDPSGMHYVYNNGSGTLACIWRGEFVDATPMWHDRGDGSFRPMGDVVYLNNKPQLDIVSDPSAKHIEAYQEGSFKSRGYTITKETNLPVFHYDWSGMKVHDLTYSDAKEQCLVREITVENPSPGARYRVANGKNIQMTGDGLYLVDGRYFIELAEPDKAMLRPGDTEADLFVKVDNQPIRYKIIW